MIVVLFILLAQLCGIVGTVFTIPAIPTWYAGLVKPSFSPPNYLFGPVWIALYTFMGISAALLYFRYKRGGKTAPDALLCLKLYTVQLFLNFIWTPVFFGLHQALLSLVIIAALDIFIFILILKAWKISKPASILLMPYFLWVSFATALNAAIWHLNI